MFLQMLKSVMIQVGFVLWRCYNIHKYFGGLINELLNNAYGYSKNMGWRRAVCL